MQTVLLIGFMIVIGAFIGGLTNFLAIKMLFRPYNVMKVGSWRLPFTPGLIPRRHEEIATQLGKMVVEHLLTADGLTKKIKSASFMQELMNWLQDKARDVLYSHLTAEELIEKHVGIPQSKQLILNKTESFIRGKYEALLDRNRNEPLGNVLPHKIQENIETQIPHITNYILVRGEQYFQSSEGKERLSMMIERFLAQKGKIGNMVTMFLGQERLVDKVQPELLKFLRDEGTHEIIEKLFVQEWQQLKQKKVADLEKYVKKDEIIDFVTRTINEQIPLYEWIERPLHTWIAPYEEKIINEWIPKSVTMLVDLFMIHADSLLKSLHLEDIVREQVQSFSLERLEVLIISIAKRELKMITYLGALLGGLIGFIQGLIVLVIG